MTRFPDRSIDRPAAWTSACREDGRAAAGDGRLPPHVGKETS
jgi:hypothetical protein